MAGASVTPIPNDSLAKLQSLHGIFAVYKKKGATSAETLNTLKKTLLTEAGVAFPVPRKRKRRLLKIGHGGTLDSNACGVLVVGIGAGTKMLTTMLAGSKKYTAVAELGKATDTLDARGNVTDEKNYDHITKEALEEKLKQFTGEIMQVPPRYSALKKKGKRMSDLMKQGQEVEDKPARPVMVYNLSLQDFNPPFFKIDVECGGGFHVRSLVNDLGKELSSCAHIRDIIRTRQDQFTLEHALREDHWTLDDISQALQPFPVPLEQQIMLRKENKEMSKVVRKKLKGPV